MTKLKSKGAELLAGLSAAEKSFIDMAAAAGYALDTKITPYGMRGFVRGYQASITELKPNSWNPNRQKAKEARATKESLRAFDQVLDIVVAIASDGHYMIVDGEHRYQTIKESDPSAIVSVTVLFGYSLAELKKLTIILNETRGQADKIELSALLSSLSDELKDSDLLREGLPFDPGEMDDILNLSSVDWADFNSTFTPPPEPTKEQPDPASAAASQSDPFPPSPSSEQPAGQSGAEPQWKDILARIPLTDSEVVKQAYIEIAASLRSQGQPLSEDAAIAWGMVVSSLSASYIANGGSTMFAGEE